MCRPSRSLFLIFRECGMSEKNKKRVDQDISPKLFFRNYDYGGPGDGIGPGTGLYRGDMSKYKSVKEFIEHSRKLRSNQRKKAWAQLLRKYVING